MVSEAQTPNKQQIFCPESSSRKPLGCEGKPPARDSRTRLGVGPGSQPVKFARSVMLPTLPSLAWGVNVVWIVIDQWFLVNLMGFLSEV